MKRLESASQLCSYTGLTPIIRRSGTSIKGIERISKMGNPKLRNLLFMCSFNAVKYNKACKELFDRIVARGKSKKLALLAVCNKLLKQAFSIIKEGVTYDDNFNSTLGGTLIYFCLVLPQFFASEIPFIFHSLLVQF